MAAEKQYRVKSRVALTVEARSLVLLSPAQAKAAEKYLKEEAGVGKNVKTTGKSSKPEPADD